MIIFSLLHHRSSSQTAAFLGTLAQYGWRRPTWTRELLMVTMVRLIGVRIHITTLSRNLALVQMRGGRPQAGGIGWDPASKRKGRCKETMSKRYLAGALDVESGWLMCVEGKRKTSPLFIVLHERLVKEHHYTVVIHVIVDNFRIHDRKLVTAALLGFHGQIRLHFLPPYCPFAN